MNKPLKNCTIETNVENTCFKFVKVDEEVRNKDNTKTNCKKLGKFNEYNICSYDYPCYSKFFRIISVFGTNKKKDNEVVLCNKEVIDVLKEAGTYKSILIRLGRI